MCNRDSCSSACLSAATGPPGGAFYLLSAALALGASAYALIEGADLWEAAALLPFLLLNLGVGT